jgi:hypothetical protein
MIRRLLYRFHQWVASYDPDAKYAKRRRLVSSTMAVSSNTEAEIQGLNFTVMPAIGGLIV